MVSSGTNVRSNNGVEINKYISKMKAPYQMKIIDIDVTSVCNLQCSCCTRLLPYQRKWYMNVENFRKAVRSLRDFPGIIAVIGGNPCMHPEFETLCKIMIEEIPDKERRGLWTNHFFKYREIAEETFGIMNLNPHNDEVCIKSLEPLKNKFWYHEGHSRHSPILVSLSDFIPDEIERFKLISCCDINQNWSAAIIEYKGQLKAYFCEVAAALDLVLEVDQGIDVTDGWWKRSIFDFIDQIKFFCQRCGIPLRIQGPYDFEGIEIYSQSYKHLIDRLSDKRRSKSKLVTTLSEVKSTESVIFYSKTLKKRLINRFFSKLKALLVK